MAGDDLKPRSRMSWQSGTLLIAVLSLAGWGVVLLVMRWLTH
jgi:hypothetical protein